MSITSALVLFSVIWFLIFFLVLQITAHTQADAGEVEPGTPPSAPSDAQIGRKALWTTLITLVVWGIIAGIIISGAINVRDFDWFHRMGPPPQGGGTGG